MKQIKTREKVLTFHLDFDKNRTWYRTILRLGLSHPDLTPDSKRKVYSSVYGGNDDQEPVVKPIVGGPHRPPGPLGSLDGVTPFRSKHGDVGRSSPLTYLRRGPLRRGAKTCGGLTRKGQLI